MGFRSIDSTTFIFAFEGPDDPLVYSQWIKRLNNSLKYEPLICNGKGKLLDFMSMMERDADKAGDKILYFIDADFDGTRGYSSDKLFMTEKYSVENYLVYNAVVDETLKNEFHCALEPKIRNRIVSVFEKCYETFLEHTAATNARIYAARILKIEIKKPLPDRIGGIAGVDLDAISQGNLTPDQLVMLEREPTDAERAILEFSFEKLEPKNSYRGKFAIMFLYKWFEALNREYKIVDSDVFRGLLRNLKPRHDEIGLGNLASKSSMPNGLAEFIEKAA
jgi:5S rRNA maturation endonuclease (ribonuclease M5)